MPRPRGGGSDAGGTSLGGGVPEGARAASRCRGRIEERRRRL